VRIHRHQTGHVPDCLQFILRKIVVKNARAAGMTAVPKKRTPDELGLRANEDGKEKDVRMSTSSHC
jgi:hypothetical protein